MSLFRFVRPYLALLALALIAAGLLVTDEAVCTDDGLFHLYRAVELEALLRAGHWLPAWTPHLAQGYGAPLFNLIPPLPPLLVVALRPLAADYLTATKLAFTLTIWLAGVAAFLFARQQWGERAGIASGAAYAFAPYFAHDVFIRGNFPETLAFVWPPLTLWALHHCLNEEDEPGRIRASGAVACALAAAFYSALILTHNIVALSASPLLIGYVGVTAWSRRSGRPLVRGALALALGLGLAAWFWIPALAERHLVHFERLLTAPDYQPQNNFLAWTDLLATPRPIDPRLINPSLPRTLGLINVLLCLPALLHFHRRWVGNVHARWIVGFLGLGLLGYALMTLPVSAPIWQALPLLNLLQFPWRMLAVSALCAALLTGAGVNALETWSGPIARRWPAIAVTVGVVLGNLAWWSPHSCVMSRTTTLGDMLRFERETHTFGSSAKGEYLPLTSEFIPNDGQLAGAIERGEEPSRLRIVQGEAHVVESSHADPLEATFTIQANTDTTLEYQQLFFPGWEVTANGVPLKIQPTAGAGLLTFSLPPGRHALHVRFGLTPLRTWTLAISVATLIGLSIFLGIRVRLRSIQLIPDPLGLGSWDLGFLALSLLILKLGVIDRFPNPLRYSAFDGQSVSGVQNRSQADFAGGVRLFGYDLGQASAAADQPTEVVLYAAVQTPVTRRYWPAIYLTDADGFVWNHPNAPLPRWHHEPPHTPAWSPDEYAQWARQITPLPGTPPGHYELWGEIFDIDSLQIASQLDEQGNAFRPRFPLGALTVTRPLEPITLQPENRAQHAFGPITLLGYDLERAETNAGDALKLTWYWRCDAPTPQALSARVRLLSPDGAAAAVFELEPANGYGTHLWQAGDQWRGQHRLPLPATLTSGLYQLAVSVTGEPGERTLAEVNVTAPERTFTAPPFGHVNGAIFEGVGELAGFSLQPDEAQDALSLSLIWKALATAERRYSVFVHLSDKEGRVWAQSDSAPANWSRPTTGWLAGEYITDPHRLSLPAELPPGDYELLVGLYDPTTGQRVPVTGPGAGADERVALQRLTLP
jgi:hypothetical protein